eukprot:232628-Pleurochrysis_carterae.AAC.2
MKKDRACSHLADAHALQNSAYISTARLIGIQVATPATSRSNFVNELRQTIPMATFGRFACVCSARAVCAVRDVRSHVDKRPP